MNIEVRERDLDLKTYIGDYCISTVALTIEHHGGMWYETYIFPADEDGNVLDWGELEGSYRGGMDHEEALHNAGYEIVA